VGDHDVVARPYRCAPERASYLAGSEDADGPHGSLSSRQIAVLALLGSLHPVAPGPVLVRPTAMGCRRRRGRRTGLGVEAQYDFASGAVGLQLLVCPSDLIEGIDRGDFDPDLSGFDEGCDVGQAGTVGFDQIGSDV